MKWTASGTAMQMRDISLNGIFIQIDVLSHKTKKKEHFILHVNLWCEENEKMYPMDESNPKQSHMKKKTHSFVCMLIAIKMKYDCYSESRAMKSDNILPFSFFCISFHMVPWWMYGKIIYCSRRGRYFVFWIYDIFNGGRWVLYIVHHPEHSSMKTVFRFNRLSHIHSHKYIAFNLLLSV